ncbi:MAG: glycosyltransferase family 9 protein [Tannerellaceae bacterium]|jgi:ADP-heptose:LPS heptosyltransferase|nr:glycosyltransferase family 9 protein [Tannerellaceae bacterium]
MAQVLIIRLSAIGDVAMTIPVIYSAAKARPQDSFTVLTQAFLIPVFMNRPPNVEMLGINTLGAEKSLRGLLRFSRALVRYDYDIILDLHDVLRTRILRTLFRLRGKRVYVIDKARKERARLTARNNKLLTPLRLMTDRYADVYRAAGLDFDGSFRSLFEDRPPALQVMESVTGKKKGKWIGIAPFAKHRGKIFPTGKMEEVIAALSEKEEATLFLFGGRGEEEAVMARWEAKYQRVRSVTGRYSLDNELALISSLDLLVSMDSANMHFASLVGTRVVSIWGATHPYSGFYGYGQRPEDAVQVELPCRPCSIYGNTTCYRGDWACMTQLTPGMILAKIEEALGI